MLIPLYTQSNVQLLQLMTTLIVYAQQLMLTLILLKKNKNFAFSLFVLFGFFYTNANAQALSGRVTDVETGKPLAYASATFLEGLPYLTRMRPILAPVQVDFITNGSEPLAEKAQTELGWQPLGLEEGLAKYLRERKADNT